MCKFFFLNVLFWQHGTMERDEKKMGFRHLHAGRASCCWREGKLRADGDPSTGHALTDQVQSWGTWTWQTAGDCWQGPLTAPDMASNKPGLESIQEVKSGAKENGARDRAGVKATKWVKEVHLGGRTRGRAGDRATMWVQIAHPGDGAGDKTAVWVKVVHPEEEQSWRPAHLPRASPNRGPQAELRWGPAPMGSVRGVPCEAGQGQWDPLGPSGLWCWGSSVHFLFLPLIWIS